MLALFLNKGYALALCTVSGPGISFSPYDVFLTAPDDTVGNLTISCNESPPPTVTVMLGASPNSGSFNPRQMAGPGGFLNYNLYTDAGYSSIWGDGSNSTGTMSAKITKGRPITFKIYGRIPPLQDVSAGQYSDTLIVTINW